MNQERLERANQKQKERLEKAREEKKRKDLMHQRGYIPKMNIAPTTSSKSKGKINR